MVKHTYNEYSDSIELAYHLLYEHALPAVIAFKLDDDELAETHRGAHS